MAFSPFRASGPVLLPAAALRLRAAAGRPGPAGGSARRRAGRRRQRCGDPQAGLPGAARQFGARPGLRPLAEARLRQAGYELVPNPSQAGYILQMNVLARGPTDPATARAVWPQATTRPPALRARRHGPGGRRAAGAQGGCPARPSRAGRGSKNISSRNAISDSQMRLGCCSASVSGRKKACLPILWKPWLRSWPRPCMRPQTARRIRRRGRVSRWSGGQPAQPLIP